MPYTIQKEFITELMGEKIVLFNSVRSKLYTLNETGKYIYIQLKKKLDEDNISQKLARKYNISYKIAQKDVSSFIQKLLKRNIISY